MDLIDRKDAINAVLGLKNCYNGFSDTYDKSCIVGLLEELPKVDAVPVVKCKDCKWWDAYYRECGSINWYPDQDGCVLQPAGMFCGWGERKYDDKRAKY